MAESSVESKLWSVLMGAHMSVGNRNTRRNQRVTAEKVYEFPDIGFDSRILVALNYISKTPPSKILALPLLAASFNLSSSYFRQIFKRDVGLSFAQHLKALRLQQARKLLQTSGSTVKQAMLEVGLMDHSHFARDYKRAFGESPSQTRMTSPGGEHFQEPTSQKGCNKLSAVELR